MKIKKRKVIAILLTFICLILTNKFWLKFRSVPIDFDIWGNGNYNVEVQLNKKNNDEFKKIKNGFITIDSNQNLQHARIEIARAKYPKRIKLIFHNVENKTPIKISNLNIKDGKINLIPSEKEAFDAIGASIKTKNDQVILYPKDNKIELVYKNKLKINPSVKFEFELFVILTVVSFLFLYKLVDYIADFKTVKNISRLDIIFLTSFFIILFIPMSHIEKEDISTQENRTLAKLNGFIKENGEINYKFGENYNEWYNDRFNLRKEVITVNKKIKQAFEPHLYCTEYACWNKRTNWMYWPSKFTQYNITEDDDTYIYSMEKLKRFAKDNQIDLYIMLAPNKCAIYNQEMNSMLPPTNEPQVTKSILKTLEDKTNINFVYPYDSFKNYKGKELLYYKADHHWTQQGSFIGYSILLNKIKEKYPNITATKESDYNFGYTDNIKGNNSQYKTLGLDNKNVFDTKYKTFIKKDLKTYSAKETVLNKTPSLFKYNFIYNNAPNKQKVMLVGDSFGLNLTMFLSYTFKNVEELFAYTPNGNEYENFNMKRFEKEIKEYKPDILIFCFSESGLNRLNYLYRKDYEKGQ